MFILNIPEKIFIFVVSPLKLKYPIKYSIHQFLKTQFLLSKFHIKSKSFYLSTKLLNIHVDCGKLWGQFIC